MDLHSSLCFGGCLPRLFGRPGCKGKPYGADASCSKPRTGAGKGAAAAARGPEPQAAPVEPTRRSGRLPSDIGLGPADLRLEADGHETHEELVVPGRVVQKAEPRLKQAATPPEAYSPASAPMRSKSVDARRRRWSRSFEADGAGTPTAVRRPAGEARPGLSREPSFASVCASEVSEWKQPPSEPEAPAAGRPHLGDIVALGAGAPPEFRLRQAIVTKVAEAHCTVVVLDDTRRFGIGECWPSFSDCTVEDRSLRLGGRVAVEGLKGAKARELNGCVGTIVLHRREGHPTFIRTKAAPDSPRLTVCVRLDSLEVAGDKSMLLEPRFLVDHAAVMARATSALGEAVASLQKAPPAAAGAGAEA